MKCLGAVSFLVTACRACVRHGGSVVVWPELGSHHLAPPDNDAPTMSSATADVVGGVAVDCAGCVVGSC